jgi:hypothetical protein
LSESEARCGARKRRARDLDPDTVRVGPTLVECGESAFTVRHHDADVVVRALVDEPFAATRSEQEDT